MEKYTIYCTKEQTKKAFELGAPLAMGGSRKIFNAMGVKDKSFEEAYDFEGVVIINDNVYLSPTSEQMINWLDEKEIYIEIVLSPYDWYWSFLINKDYTEKTFYTRSEAIIAAIDAALDYLIESRSTRNT